VVQGPSCLCIFVHVVQYGDSLDIGYVQMSNGTVKHLVCANGTVKGDFLYVNRVQGISTVVCAYRKENCLVCSYGKGEQYNTCIWYSGTHLVRAW
jgi:hypothetical protein